MSFEFWSVAGVLVLFVVGVCVRNAVKQVNGCIRFVSINDAGAFGLTVLFLTLLVIIAADGNLC